MAKVFAFVIPTILFLAYGICEGLECYHCYSGEHAKAVDANFVPCNEANLTASNSMVCQHPKAQCIIETVEVTATKMRQVWRTCSNGISDPCDPNALPPGLKMIKCSHCGTDKCNLNEKEAEKEKNTFTFNINANVNLFIRQ